MLTQEELSRLPELTEAETVQTFQPDGSVVCLRRPLRFSAL